jgi:hypothetical protein
MKIELSHNVELELFNKTYNITYRPLSAKDKKSIEKEHIKLLKISDKVEKLTRQEIYTTERLEAYKELGESDKVLKMLDKLEKIEEEAQKLKDEFEEMGGNDIETLIYKKEFDLCIEGKDKEALREAIEENTSYGFILSNIKKNIMK